MASIKDVAQLAGVGIGTVSRVINGTGYVAESTRDRVQAAISELGYVPNEIARSFQAQRSGMVALIVPSIDHPLFGEMAFHVERQLDRDGYRMMLGNSLFEVDKEVEFIRLLERNVIDGMIIVSNSAIDSYLAVDMPVVTIDRHLSNEFAFVTSDNFAGGKMAAEHLIASGCRSIAYVGGFPPVETEVLKRRSGFVAAAEAAAGVAFELIDYGTTIADERAFVRSFVAEHPEVDGVFALTDMLGLQLIAAYEEAGVDVPGEVQVVGYDGITIEGMGSRRLSTIRQPVDEMGTAAAELVLAVIDGKDVERRLVFPVEFIQGESTRARP